MAQIAGPFAVSGCFAGRYGLQDRLNADLIKIFSRESESLGPVISVDEYTTVSKEDFQFATHENSIALVDL